MTGGSKNSETTYTEFWGPHCRERLGEGTGHTNFFFFFDPRFVFGETKPKNLSLNKVREKQTEKLYKTENSLKKKEKVVFLLQDTEGRRERSKHETRRRGDGAARSAASLRSSDTDKVT